jgi:DNA-binding response OmpR family regulator
MYKILLVEDSEIFADLVSHTLGANFDVVPAIDLERALKSLKAHPFDLILLDINLPDGDGFHFFSMLLNSEEYKQIPVIFLSAKNDVAAKVLGITLGAEDYIVKPIEPAEFKARIEMRLKKHHMQHEADQLYQKGDLEINIYAQKACLITNEKKVDIQLTALEFKLLALLAAHENQVFSRNQLFDKIWGNDVYLTDRCIDTHIYLLRKKLGACANYIQTIYGEGYRFSLEYAQEEKLAS